MSAVGVGSRGAGTRGQDWRLTVSPLLRLRLTGSGRYDSGRYKMLVRWLKFNAVGAMGVVVQLAVLSLLVRVVGLPIVVGTGLAVETAIVHNFAWHRGWTWADRKGPARAGGAIEAVRGLFRFNVSTGMVSLVGNMLLMQLLAATTRLGLLTANLVTIAMCSLVNFVVSDRFVFRLRN